MDTNKTGECCNGCQKGRVGENAACKAKLMVETIKQKTQDKHKITKV